MQPSSPAARFSPIVSLIIPYNYPLVFHRPSLPPPQRRGTANLPGPRAAPPPGPAAQSAAAEPGPGERGVRRSGHGHPPSAPSLPPRRAERHQPAVPAASSGRAARARLSLQPRPRPPPPAAVRAAPTAAAASCLCAPGPSGGGEGASGAGGGGGSGSFSHGVRQPQLSPPLLPAAATSCAAMVQFLSGRWGQESRAAGSGGGRSGQSAGLRYGSSPRYALEPAPQHTPPPDSLPLPTDAAARGRRCSRPAEADGRRVDGSAKAAARGIDQGDSPQRRKPLRNAVKKRGDGAGARRSAEVCTPPVCRGRDEPMKPSGLEHQDLKLPFFVPTCVCTSEDEESSRLPKPCR